MPGAIVSDPSPFAEPVPADGAQNPISSLEYAGDGTADFALPHSVSVGNRDLLDAEVQFDGADLHFHSPPVSAVVHIDPVQCGSTDGAKRSEIPEAISPSNLNEFHGQPRSEALRQSHGSGGPQTWIPVADDQIRPISQYRLDQIGQFIGIVAQIRVEKHHDLNRMDQVFHSGKTCRAVPSARFADDDGAVRFCDGGSFVVGSVVGDNDLTQIVFPQNRQKVGERLGFIEGRDDDGHFGQGWELL